MAASDETADEWYEVSWYKSGGTPPACEFFFNEDRAKTRARNIAQSPDNLHVKLTYCEVIDFG